MSAKCRLPLLWMWVTIVLPGIPHVTSTQRPSPETPTTLLLTPLLDAGRPDLARQFSEVGPLPALFIPAYSGFITVDRDLGNHLFFFFYPSTKDPDTSPLLIWLPGVPGLGATFDLLWSHGPARIIRDRNNQVRVIPREDFLAEEFSFVYIDNVVGAGYSYSDNGVAGYRNCTNAVTNDLYEFLLQFYEIFPEYKTRPLYIGGHGYGGKFAVSLAYFIHQEILAGRPHIPLAGIYSSAGVIDFPTQIVGQHDNFYALGAESYSDSKAFIEASSTVVRQIKSGMLTSITMTQLINIAWNVELLSLFGMESGNYVTAEPLDVDGVNSVYRTPAIRRSLHVGENVPYEAFDKATRDMFGIDSVFNVKEELGVLLDNYKVLFFDGDYDFLIPILGTEKAILTTPWSRQEEYHNSTRNVWLDVENGKLRVKGYYTLVGQFCRVIVHGAGHFPAHDQPSAVFEAITEFVKYGCVD